MFYTINLKRFRQGVVRRFLVTFGVLLMLYILYRLLQTLVLLQPTISTMV
ncbi:MAG TPA: hypothetical protein GXZ82_06070 [Firmicutes bacterium]|jgi:hypothetical protein|nr:hypothetical protein [Bacillota bacterium]